MPQYLFIFTLFKYSPFDSHYACEDVDKQIPQLYESVYEHSEWLCRPSFISTLSHTFTQHHNAHKHSMFLQFRFLSHSLYIFDDFLSFCISALCNGTFFEWFVGRWAKDNGKNAIFVAIKRENDWNSWMRNTLLNNEFIVLACCRCRRCIVQFVVRSLLFCRLLEIV